MHGERRGYRRTVTAGNTMTYVDADGNEVYRGPTVLNSSFAEERYCETCGEWREIRGIMGVLTGCPKCGREW